MTDRLQRAMRSAALEAGRLLLSMLGRLRRDQIAYKTSIDLVTEADRRAEALVRRRLGRLFPTAAFLGEEEGRSGSDTADLLFVLDPLDGTTNFVHGHPFFAVSLACRREGRTVAGVVYAPALKTLYEAVEGQGAFRNHRPVRVSPTPDLLHSLLITGFACVREGRKPDNVPIFAKAIYTCQGIRRSGSAALDLCFVADGRADLFWELGLNPWDVAAGSLIVQEAGGKVTDLSGGPDFIDRRSIVASNGLVHEEFLRLVASVDPAYTT